jgi:hypothetical protein
MTVSIDLRLESELRLGLGLGLGLIGLGSTTGWHRSGGRAAHEHACAPTQGTGQGQGTPTAKGVRNGIAEKMTDDMALCDTILILNFVAGRRAATDDGRDRLDDEHSTNTAYTHGRRGGRLRRATRRS